MAGPADTFLCQNAQRDREAQGMKTLAPLALRSFLVLSALLATACGGEEPAIAEQAQSLSESSGPRTTDGNCSSVCHEVVACCICKCHEDYPSPGSYACDAGCLVLDTIFGNDDEELVFVDPSGTAPPPGRYVVGPRRSLSVQAGMMSSAGAFKSVDGLSARVAIIALDDYLQAVAQRQPPRFTSVGSARGHKDRFDATVDLRRIRPGPYLLQMANGSETALAMVEIL